MSKQLTKSYNKSLDGVCAGIAEYFEIDTTIVRILWAVFTLFTAWFPGIILYLICMFVMPDNINSNNSIINKNTVIQ